MNKQYTLEDLVRAFFECPQRGLLKLQEPIKNRIQYLLYEDSSVDDFQSISFKDDGHENDVITFIQSLDIDIIVMEEISRKFDDVNEGPEPNIWYKTYRSDGNHTENRLTYDALMTTAQEIILYDNLAFNPYFDFKES